LELLDDAAYARLETLGARLEAGIQRVLRSCRQPATVQRVGSMITLFFHPGPIRSWNEAKACDTKAFGRFHGALLEEGVYWPPAQFEAAFLSLAHDESVVDRSIDAIGKALAQV
jgi:glutamate-1-semialdehyde 2,1-aminomutase